MLAHSRHTRNYLKYAWCVRSISFLKKKNSIQFTVCGHIEYTAQVRLLDCRSRSAFIVRAFQSSPAIKLTRLNSISKQTVCISFTLDTQLAYFRDRQCILSPNFREEWDRAALGATGIPVAGEWREGCVRLRWISKCANCNSHRRRRFRRWLQQRRQSVGTVDSESSRAGSDDRWWSTDIAISVWIWTLDAEPRPWSKCFRGDRWSCRVGNRRAMHPTNWALCHWQRPISERCQRRWVRCGSFDSDLSRWTSCRMD